jgi:hypothetical protein
MMSSNSEDIKPASFRVKDLDFSVIAFVSKQERLKTLA